jgi:hypothetical protein
MVVEQAAQVWQIEIGVLAFVTLAPAFFESIDEHFSLAQQVDAGVDRFAPFLKKTRGYRVLDESFVVSRNVCVHNLHLSRLVT